MGKTAKKSNEKESNYQKKDLRELVKKNLELNQEMYKMLKSVKTHILIQRIFFILKVVIILIPLILGVIYLPPLIKDWMHKYQSWLQWDQGQLWRNLFPNKNTDANHIQNMDKQSLEKIKNNLSPEQKKQLIEQFSR